MKHFLTINDLTQLDIAVTEANALKKAPYKFNNIGENKTLGMLFFNPSSVSYTHQTLPTSDLV